MKIKSYYVKGFGYDSMPQDGKGNELYDEVEVILTKKEFNKLTNFKDREENEGKDK